jgi:hypothetical protein
MAKSALCISERLRRADALSATTSELCSRNLLKSEKGVLMLAQEIVDKLARGEGVPIAPGKAFYAR